MHPFCLSAALLVLLVTAVAGTKEKEASHLSTDSPPAFCMEPAFRGPCKILLIRWFFNAGSGFCEPFLYGGCRPKQNHFMTQEECVAICGPRPTVKTEVPTTVKEVLVDEPEEQNALPELAVPEVAVPGMPNRVPV